MGIYIVVSLIFVLGTMIEFAIILWLKKKHDNSFTQVDTGLVQSMNNQQAWKVDDSQKMKGKNEKGQEMKRKMARIDEIAFALFTLTYLIFNIFYFVFSKLAH